MWFDWFFYARTSPPAALQWYPCTPLLARQWFQSCLHHHIVHGLQCILSGQVLFHPPVCKPFSVILSSVSALVPPLQGLFPKVPHCRLSIWCFLYHITSTFILGTVPVCAQVCKIIINAVKNAYFFRADADTRAGIWQLIFDLESCSVTYIGSQMLKYIDPTGGRL